VLTPEEFRQIRRLHLQASRRVDSPFAGEYRSAFRGQGMEFEEVRPYIPGDDVRHIDWNVTARAGAPFIKEFREERELTLVLVLDVSGSVGFGSGGLDGRTDKRLQLARLAGALAFAAIRNRDQVGMLAFSDRVERYLPPRKSRSHAWAVMHAAFEASSDHRGTDLAKALERLGKGLRRRSVICVLSDFMAPRPFDRELRVLAARHTVHAFMVHDPLEHALPDVGLVELEDRETGAVRLVDARTISATQSLKGRIGQLSRAGARARAVGTHQDPYHELLLHFRGQGGR
jgi:uncharacterized protein (DUF58 family)